MQLAAFEELFRTHHSALCTYVNAFVGAPDIADEIVQDLFMQVWRDWSGVPPAGNPRAWLFAAARNRALNHLKRHRLEERFAVQGGLDELHSPAGPADRLLHERELREAIDEAFASLPPRAREAAELRWRQQLSYGEIAAVMKISTKSVENHLARVRDSLRILLDRFR